MVGSHLLDFLIKNTNWEIHGLVRWRSSLENIESHIENINKKREYIYIMLTLETINHLFQQLKKVNLTTYSI